MRYLRYCAKCGAKILSSRVKQKYCDNCVYTVVSEQDKQIRDLKNSLHKYQKAFEDVKKITGHIDTGKKI